jgi:hypothetical protein
VEVADCYNSSQAALIHVIVWLVLGIKLIVVKIDVVDLIFDEKKDDVVCLMICFDVYFSNDSSLLWIKLFREVGMMNDSTRREKITWDKV